MKSLLLLGCSTVACATLPAQSVASSPGLMERVSQTLCQVENVESWVVQLDTLEVTARTASGVYHTLPLSNEGPACVLPATSDMPLKRLVETVCASAPARAPTT